MLSRMDWINCGRSFHVDGLKTYLLAGVLEMSSMNCVPYVPKSPTAIVTTVTPSPFSVVAICLAFAACALSGTGSAMIERQVVAPDIGQSGT